MLTQFREFFEERKSPLPNGTFELRIANAKETLFGLGSHFRITPQEYDEFFRVHPGDVISEDEFVGLVSYHESELLRIAGIQIPDMIEDYDLRR